MKEGLFTACDGATSVVTAIWSSGGSTLRFGWTTTGAGAGVIATGGVALALAVAEALGDTDTGAEFCTTGVGLDASKRSELRSVFGGFNESLKAQSIRSCLPSARSISSDTIE